MSDYLNLAQRLIEVESTSSKPDNLQKVISICETNLSGFFVKKFEKNSKPSLLISNQNANDFKIILNAHLDVVPGNSDQFVPKISNDQLIGRGASDMKGAAAVEIAIFKELGSKLPYALGLQLVTDEEIGGFDCTKHQIEQGVRAEFVIAGEPTDLGVNTKAKGVIWLKVTAHGTSAHGAYPWDGNNALWILHTFLSLVQKKFKVPRSEVWKTTVNLSQITTPNQSYNKVPDTASAYLDIRCVPEDASTVIDLIRSFATSDIDVEIVMNEPVQHTDAKNHFVQLLRQKSKSVTGKVSPIIVKHGGSDIRHFNSVGVPGVTFGPVGAGLHTDSEWASIKGLEDYYQILKSFLLSVK